MGKLQGHQIFEGPPEERTLALDSIALHTNTYKSVGQMLSVCLIHGGVSPNFFSKRLFSQVFGLPSGPATIEDVVDHGLRAKLEKINSADTLDDAREAVSETAEELALMGALRHLRSLEQRKELMEAVLQFYCEGRINAALTQFKDGLTTLGVLQMVTSHPQAFEKVFPYDPTPLKASDIVELFHARCRSLPA
ncbi:G2/M phase-specific E3 ubiquitin-protein ligase-like [Astyanax mexicanus]|uniref:G2/M phase-specific E3 ubiquitin-protein ligase-like n=1 Tax=Astyanax mexicanus TaxID=7994 RepID=UPI0020CAE1C4|nr:G2/M phase-specific E3 ubiquitin-protein ligase-like [Astyanax mexicanus]